MQVFESLAVLLSELDVLLSFADLAASCPTPYTRPDITSPVMIQTRGTLLGLFLKTRVGMGSTIKTCHGFGFMKI